MSTATVNNADRVLDQLDLWAEAITHKSSSGRGGGSKIELTGIKKLRELILELAVRGLLVEEKTSDKSAGENLREALLQRQELINKKIIRKPKKLPPIEQHEVPYEIPDNWSAVRLNDLGDWGAGATPKRSEVSYYGGQIPWFKSGELIGDYISESEEYVTDKALDETSLRYNMPGDVLIAMYGATIGKTSILKSNATTNQAVCACTPNEAIDNRYLLKILKAWRPRFLAMGAGGAQPNISREKIIATVVGLPPLAEQHRIVAKVDELMALCDQLEQQQTDQLAAHDLLVKTLLDALVREASAPTNRETTDANPSGFATAWARLANHFDTLFTTESSIQQLRQTLLQLAVMGRLVPQKRSDKAPKQLLENIDFEKNVLVNEGRLRRVKTKAASVDLNKPFMIPRTWEWSSLSDLFAIVTDGDHQAPPKSDSGVPFLVIGNLNTGEINFNNCRYVTSDYYDDLDWIKKPAVGDLLYTVTGSYGIPVSVNMDRCFCVQRHVAILKATDSTPTEYLLLVLKSKYAFDYATSISTGIAQKTVPLSGLRNFPVAVPPEEEQHRIVAKVYELMKLCDQLQARVQAARETKLQLATSVTQQALAERSELV